MYNVGKYTCGAVKHKQFIFRAVRHQSEGNTLFLTLSYTFLWLHVQFNGATTS